MIRMTNTLLFAVISITTSFGQEKIRFSGEEQLRSCEIEIPLYYATKNQPALNEAANKYKDVELVLLTLDKKKGPSYKFYYLVGFQNDFGPSAYLIESKYRNQERRPEHAWFLDYKPKKHIFYTADCFKENPAHRELKLGE